jgi:hypothetical protein
MRRIDIPPDPRSGVREQNHATAFLPGPDDWVGGDHGGRVFRAGGRLRACIFFDFGGVRVVVRERMALLVAIGLLEGSVLDTGLCAGLPVSGVPLPAAGVV